MSRAHHELKTETVFYRAVEKGHKAFEVRKNDRDFLLHDMVTLKETANGIYTGRSLGPFEITYVLEGGQFGIDPNYVVFQMERGR